MEEWEKGTKDRCPSTCDLCVTCEGTVWGRSKSQVDLLLISKGSEDEARARIRLHPTTSFLIISDAQGLARGFLASTTKSEGL